MDRSSQYMYQSENKGQYPTQEEIIDPYLNDETVGVPQEDQRWHHDNNFYPSQEEQELEQRGRHSQEWDFKPQDEAMDQNPGSLGAFNLEVTQSGQALLIPVACFQRFLKWTQKACIQREMGGPPASGKARACGRG